jgi:hypothetical protein
MLRASDPRKCKSTRKTKSMLNINYVIIKTELKHNSFYFLDLEAIL